MKRPTVPPPLLRMPRGRRTPLAAVASLLGHLLLVILVFGVARAGQPFVPDDAYLTEFGGGGGGGQQVAFLALPAPEVPEAKPVPVVERTEVRDALVTPPPVDVPTEIPPPVDLPTPPDTVPQTADSAATGGGSGSGGGVGTGSGTGVGPGVGPGSGPGSGGGTGGGERGLARPPEPRQVILPPFDVPRAMRGRTIAVTFFVEADGRVARVTFAPEVPDRGFAKKLEDVMRAYRFRPARSAAGVPIPGTYTVSVTF